MPDPTFESRFERELLAYAEGGVRHADPLAIAVALHGATPRPLRPRFRLGPPPAAVRWLAVAALVAIALLAGLILIQIGSDEQLLADASPRPTAAEPTAGLTERPSVPVVPDGPRVYTDELALGPSLATPMGEPRLVPLLDGRVLIISGFAELYDPDTGSQELVASYVDSGVWAATRARDGRVLVVGMDYGASGGPLAIAQVFDPETDTFSMVGPMIHPRDQAVAVALADGRILIGGGVTDIDTDVMVTSAEVFDPMTTTFADVGQLDLLTDFGLMTVLADDRVLLIGGTVDHVSHTTAPGPMAAEIYDPVTGQFTPTALPTNTPRFLFATADGGAIGFGGYDPDPGTIDAWDAVSGTWRRVGTTPTPFSQVVALEDGRFLGTHEYDTAIVEASGDLTMLRARTAWEPKIAALADGRIMIAGGTVDGIYHPGKNGPGSLGPPDPVDTVVFFR